jgi:hypothetical protein
MKFGVMVAAASAALLACGQREQTTGEDTIQADSRSADTSAAGLVVDAHGIGVVRVGMTLGELNAALGDSLRPAYEINEECDFVTPQALRGASLMILLDSVARVDVDAPGILTREGAGVGDTEASVLALYGARARVQPHKYTGPEGHYVIISTPGDTAYRIIFETDGKKVERYRAGRSPGVDYIEGCA